MTVIVTVSSISKYPGLQVWLPIRTVSEANNRDSRRKKAKRAADQRGTTTLVLRSYLARPPLAATITFTFCRLSTKCLDDDNLRSALKAVRDGVADWLGIDDGNERLVWHYDQALCKRGQEGIWVTVSL